MATNTITNTENKNIVVGPDYSQMVNLHTNGAIIEAFIAMLFSNKTKFNGSTISIMLRNMAILLFIKTILEDSKSVLDKFRFTNLSVMKYMYQRVWYSTVNYEIVMVGKKWMYGDRCISINTLTSFLEHKSIYLSQPGIYYYYYMSYMVKVNISEKTIAFYIPNISCVIKHMDDVIHKNEEIIFGSKTTVLKMAVTPSNIIKLEPVQLVHAFKTSNYQLLEESIKTNFTMDAILKFPSPPYCVNFDGEPGTGKTTFASYIAVAGLFDRVVICNLMQVAQLNFQDFITNLEKQISNTSNKERKIDEENEKILIIFDEIDKWLESYISGQIDKMRAEARSSKQSVANNVQTIETVEKMTDKEEDEKRIQYRTEFLDHLYRLVDGHILPDTRKYVIIFNTNHFDSLFVNMNKRFDALIDRFGKYKFEKINKQDIIHYLKCINNSLQSYLSNDDIKKKLNNDIFKEIYINDESIFEKINDDIKISYRSLHKILRMNGFRIKNTITALNNLNS